MDGQATRCAQCGAPLSTTGRFCTNCGAPVAPVASAPWAPPEPTYDESATSERVYAVPDEPAYAEPVYAEPVYAEPVYAPPVYAEPLGDQTVQAQPFYADPPPPRRSPGVGLWVGAAAGLVLVLVLGAFLLLSGGSGDDSPSASATPLVPKPQPTDTPPPTKAPTSSAPPTSAPTSAPTGPPADVAGLSLATAPSHAPAGVDFSGQPVTFVAPNMVDGIVETCWRTPGRRDRHGPDLPVGTAHHPHEGRADQRLCQDGVLRRASLRLVPGRPARALRRLGLRRRHVGQPDVRRDPCHAEPHHPAGDHVDGPGPDHRRLAAGHGPATRNDTAVSEVSLVGSAS